MTTLRLLPPADFTSQLLELEPLLLKVARKLCGKPDDACDLVQDTLERALRAGASPSTNVRAWLLSILHHRFIDLWRKRACVHAPEALEELPAEPPREEPRWAAVDCAQLRAAAGQLHPAYREVFLLHALEGVAYAEVARRLGIPKATVGTRLFRARQRLRAILDEQLRREGSEDDFSLARRRARATSCA